MGLIILAVAGAIVWWAWTKGHVRALRTADVAAVVAALVGLQFLRHGQSIPAFVALGGAGWWAWRRRRVPAAAAAMTPTEARRLLDVPVGASPDEIRSAHRRLVSRVHPDVGGSADLTIQVNAARDLLLGDRM